MYIGAKAVEPLAGYKLLITFENDEKRVFDVTPYLQRGIFAELKDTAVFSSVRISFDTVEWRNGADICPETLYEDSLPVEESQEATMTAAV